MIGLDTNVLVRYITLDDPRQSPKAARLIDALTVDDPGYISLVSVVELVWVLGDCYGAGREQISTAIEGLLRSKELVIAEADTVWRALRLFESGQADLADCLIERLGAAAGCAETVTFDRAAARHCGMRLVE